MYLHEKQMLHVRDRNTEIKIHGYLRINKPFLMENKNFIQLDSFINLFQNINKIYIYD